MNGDITNCTNGSIVYTHKFDIIKKVFPDEAAGHSITISLLLLEFHENLISLKHSKPIASQSSIVKWSYLITILIMLHFEGSWQTLSRYDISSLGPRGKYGL